MVHHQIETQWMGKMQFNALLNGHTVIMDAPAHAGGENNGPIPKPFVLAALSGCTGMDVIALLRKTNITLLDFSLKVDGVLSKQQPLEYVSIHIVYDIKGNDQDKYAVIQAITDSQEKLCGVSHAKTSITRHLGNCFQPACYFFQQRDNATRRKNDTRFLNRPCLIFSNDSNH